MRLVALGDIHVYRLTAPVGHWIGKPLLGQFNLLLRRRRRFRHDLFPAVVQRALDLKPDLVLLTGDLTTTASRGEFADAARALAPLTLRGDVAGVPGNHDRYTGHSLRRKLAEAFLPAAMPTSFPDLRWLGGRWWLLRLDSAVPRLLSSRGRIGPFQFRQARSLLTSMESGDGLIVMCHYAVRGVAGERALRWNHRLADEGELRAFVSEFPGRVIYLHGHVHRPWSGSWTGTPPGKVLDVNAGAPAMVSGAFPLGQGLWQIDLPTTGADAVELVHHCPAPSTDGERTVSWHQTPHRWDPDQPR